jgi:spore germination cell wall hydrolase CwlJ-like protein
MATAAVTPPVIPLSGPGQNARWSRRRSWPWRLLLVIAAIAVALLLTHQVFGRIAVGNRYSVTVPVELKPYDPELWSLVNAESFEAAQALDAALPDPALLAEAASGAPPPDKRTMQQAVQEAYTGPAARPYAFRGRTATDTTRAHYCLTAAIYYEAASETDDGMRGVAQVVLNRTRHPSFPGSICGVVFQGSNRAIVCQFTFACDGAMARAPSRANWARASRIASEALGGRVFAPVGLATFYHTQAIWPSWGRSLAMTNVVGAHIFHRFRGRYGTPAAFSRPYAGVEPQPGPYLPIAAQLAARAGRAAPGASVPGTTPADPALATSGTPIAPLSATAAPQPGFASNPVAPAAPPRAAPAYADPRLAQSGSVREEYRNSGSAIAR